MTFAAEEPGQILSQDARGRVLVSRERRESLLEEYDRSGMSGVKFAQYVGIKYSTLAYWLQSRRRHRRREKLLLKAAQLIVSKYCDDLPLYRQEQIYWDRHQVWLPRQSMARWVQLASEWLKPIYR